MLKRVSASVAVALALLVAPAGVAEAGASKVFASYSYYNAKAKCEGFTSQLLRDGYAVTQRCTYIRWDWPKAPPQHAFVVSWRN